MNLLHLRAIYKAIKSQIAQLQSKLFILCTCLILVSCDNAPQNPMRIGTSLWPGYEPLYLANHLKLLPAEDFRLVEYPSTTQVIRAFRNNTLDAALMTIDEALVMAEDKLEIEIILVLDHSTGANVIVSQPEFVNFPELKGKTIAVEANTLGAFLIHNALEQYKMSPQDLNIVPLGVSEHQSAFFKKEVDAVLTSEPVRTKIINLGANELFSTREMFGQVYDVLVVRKSYLREHKYRASTLTNAWFEAIDYFRQYNDEATAVMSARMQITPSEVINSYRGLSLCNLKCNQKMLNSANGSLKNKMLTLAKTMKRYNLMENIPDISLLLNDKYVRKNQENNG